MNATVHREVIIHLISQDMMQHQWFANKQIMNGGLGKLDFITAVSALMGLEAKVITGDWHDNYLGYMKRAERIALEDGMEPIIELAIECYGMMAIVTKWVNKGVRRESE